MTKISQLKQAKQFFRDNPSGEIIVKNLWPEKRYNADQYRQWFLGCLNNKINSHGPNFPKGRKADYAYFMELWRASRLINSRCIIDWLPKDLNKRFSHRLRKNMEL